ncbi:putative cell-cycle link protein [abaca bunchy top virus]|uniref:Cell-cycle link protein n=1 Tax=abaca bunchy top virus TaxID=3158377 RepID=B0LBX7_9VIRU|nr:putative cell-cycle link protein [Abaca bunchy top virus]ABP96964.1 putative cell-cycle link protein [Abaca bunchy top virus]
MEFWNSEAFCDDVKRVIKQKYWEERMKSLFIEKVSGYVRRILVYGNLDDTIYAVQQMKTSIVQCAERFGKACVVVYNGLDPSIGFRLHTMAFFFEEYVEEVSTADPMAVQLFCDEEIEEFSNSDVRLIKNVIMASTDASIDVGNCIQIIISDNVITFYIC